VDNDESKLKIMLWQEKEMNDQFESLMLNNCVNNWLKKGSLLAFPEELFVRKSCNEKLLNFRDVANDERLKSYLSKDLAEKYLFKLLPDVSEARLYTATCDEIKSTDNISYRFAGEPTVLRAAEGKVVLPQELINGGVRDTNDPDKEHAMAKAFLLVTGEGEDKKVYGFTGWHLAFWHWKKQIEEGQEKIGSDGEAYPVEIDVREFE